MLSNFLNSIKRALNGTNKISNSTYVWNTLNATILACQSPVIIMVMTRTNGIKDVGIFSIAYAVANLMVFIGQYGIRRFQASDIKEKYSFGHYYGARIITCIVMMLISLLYCLYGVVFCNYNADKFIMVILMCCLKCIQAYSDVIHGRMQQEGRLDIAAKVSCLRYSAEIAAFVIALIITRNSVLSAAVCVLISLIVLCMTTLNVSGDYCVLKAELEWQKIKQLLIEGFPLFCSLFLNMYISNAPKYAIDANLTEEIQAYYNMIFMPAFMIGLLANFIFNPILTSYAEVWNKSKINRFKRLIVKQVVIILGIIVLGLGIAYFIGIPILSLIFGVDLSAYRMELCVVMIGGGMLAYATFFSTVITIIRCQGSLIFCYGIAAAVAKLFSGILVSEYGIMGAAALYALIMTVLCIMLCVVMIWKISKNNRNE